MSGGIFISYRRDDTRQAAGRLADDLAEAFGGERIFRDIEKIEIGVDFTQALEKALAECEVMLVLIGRQWSSIADGQGRRRLDQPEDWIRAEIVTALKRGIRVVPVLVDGAALPAEAELPEDLRPLLRRQAVELEDARWRGDVARLVDGLGRMPGLSPRASAVPAAPPPVATVPAALPAGRTWKRVAGGAVALLALVVLGNLLFDGGSPPVTETTEAAPEAAPSVAGRWKTEDDKWTVDIVQDGGMARLVVRERSLDDRIVETGEGSLNVRTLSFDLTPAPGVERRASTCLLELLPEDAALRGGCTEEGQTVRYDFNLVRAPGP